MKSKLLYQPIEVDSTDFQEWTERPLVYHYYELVSVQEGSGTRHVNNNEFSYKKGDIFIFTPQDCRGFVAKSPTRFSYIRFSKTFLATCDNDDNQILMKQWLDQLQNLIFFRNKVNQIIIADPTDMHLLSNLFESVTLEYKANASFQFDNLKHMVTVMLNIFFRNIVENPVAKRKIPEAPLQPDQIIDYIHMNISEPHKLKIKYLAERFTLSANYISEYFRKQTGQSLRDYIGRYRLNIARQRVINSKLTINEIAYELGYSDESHLSTQFKRRFSISPIECRKRNMH